LLLGEANFYIEKSHNNFRNWYNQQHVLFNNQVAKSYYAPDFLPARDHQWWEWLCAASVFYPIVGDKMAFSSAHFGHVSPANIRTFFEARFYPARYIFLIRSPVQTVLSLIKQAGISKNELVPREIDAWLQYIQFWADFVRSFPNTLTLISEKLNEHTVEEIGSFIGEPMQEAAVLLNAEERRHHPMQSNYPILEEFGPELAEIFALVEAALRSPRALWQAEQKRTLVANDTHGSMTAQSSKVPQPIGQAWVLAQALRESLVRRLGNMGTPEPAS
jgi:hypothetical protein